MANDPFRSTDFSLTIPDRIAAYFRSVTSPHEYSGFETYPLQQVQLVSYSLPLRQTIYRLTVPVGLCNKDANLHGGAVSTLLDNLSSTALYTISKPGFWDNQGVSRSLYVVFHRPVPAGSKARIVCSVVNAGRKMTTLKGELILESEGEEDLLCATCIHEKFYTGLISKL